MTDPIYIGFDPGKTGAVVHLSLAGKLLSWHRIPLKKMPRGRKEIDRSATAKLFPLTGDVRVTMETVGSRPGEGVVGAFSFGRSLGIVEGVVAARGFSERSVLPRMWQAEMLRGLPGGDKTKISAVTAALRIWPELEETLKVKAAWDVADAALIGEFGRRNLFLRKSPGKI